MMPAEQPAAWPSDCEHRYVYRAHAKPTSDDATPYQVAASSQYHVSFFFKPEWGTAHVQLLQSQSTVDNKTVVHHWNLYAFDDANFRDGEIRGSASEVTPTVPGEVMVVAGAAGTPATLRIPNNVGLRVPIAKNPGLRLELHYFNPTDQPQPDSSSVEICVTSKPRPHEGAGHWLGTFNILVPPHQKTDLVSVCQPTAITEPVHIMALAPHMHRTGVSSRIVLNRKAGDSVSLHDRSFSFAEQRIYEMPGYGTPDEIIVQPGDTITTTCTYQNDSDETLIAGENTENEMCIAMLFAWPLGQLVNGTLLTYVVPGATADVNCLN
jgi:hypothetical protein